MLRRTLDSILLVVVLTRRLLQPGLRWSAEMGSEERSCWQCYAGVTMTDRPEQDPRIYFAAERTFLAWLRTGLALMGFGFVVARFGLFLREIAVATGSQIPATGSSRWFSSPWES